jgi:hypothetical protein
MADDFIESKISLPEVLQSLGKQDRSRNNVERRASHLFYLVCLVLIAIPLIAAIWISDIEWFV